MTSILTANQIKAARAYLGWSQEDLAAAADLSITTVRSLENGHISLRSVRDVRKAYEQAGLEFIDNEGVRRRLDEVRLLQSANSCEEFFEDMLATLESKGGDVLVMTKSQEMLLRSCGDEDARNPRQLLRLHRAANVKCLLSVDPTPLLALPSFQFRVAPAHVPVPSSYYLYGDKLVIVLREGRSHFRFVTLATAGFAQEWRSYFLSLWDCAVQGTESVTNIGRSALG